MEAQKCKTICKKYKKNRGVILIYNTEENK